MHCRSGLVALALTFLVLGGCRSTPPSSAPTGEWSYSGATGPGHWGDLKPEYALARSGRAQSPIDIVPASATQALLGPIEVAYASTTVDILNNGHTVEDDYHGGGGIRVEGHEYALAQFHFHTPSEHTLEGRHFPLEMHLVHRDSAGALAVVAVLFEQGEPHAALGALEAHFPTEPGRAQHVEGVTVNPSDLLPSSLASFRYPGSLTTPPCSEGVAWFVLQQPLQAAAEQIAAVHAILHDNNRPTQPLHGRTVTASR
jgi:carbonic anhydrase